MSNDNYGQLQWFKAYVASGRAPRWTMAPADIHGFLTGLAMAGPLPDTEWTSWIWSGDVPEFESEAEEWSVMTDLLAYEVQVREALGNYRILTAAILPHGGNGWFFAADWAEGFLQAIEANPHPWRKAVDLAEPSLSVVLGTCYHSHDEYNSGYIGFEALDELNYHLRHLNRVMQNAAGYVAAVARAA
ncbi:UPF0149 family protein [Aestuariivirga sp.]|uniref:UPF0149 family protein n=1 Tax=Aestuariivirga sp. TaxID=2650926 RepID=UPI003BAA0DBE